MEAPRDRWRTRASLPGSRRRTKARPSSASVGPRIPRARSPSSRTGALPLCRRAACHQCCTSTVSAVCSQRACTRRAQRAAARCDGAARYFVQRYDPQSHRLAQRQEVVQVSVVRDLPVDDRLWWHRDHLHVREGEAGPFGHSPGHPQLVSHHVDDHPSPALLDLRRCAGPRTSGSVVQAVLARRCPWAYRDRLTCLIPGGAQLPSRT
jgi:hypothetical protein